ncbi:hypothetical protein Hanom_Chr07g00624131 [Helianthus anomalus]
MVLFIDIYAYMCTDYFDRIAMASSVSSGVYDDHAHRDISFDDEPFPFALPNPVHDGEPLVDEILAVGPQLNQFIIIDHPDGAHIVDYIPLDVVPLAGVPGDVVIFDDEDDVPVIHVGHPDDAIGGGENLDIAILETLATTCHPPTSAELGYTRMRPIAYHHYCYPATRSHTL